MAKAKRVRIPLMAELIDPVAEWSGTVIERADQPSKRGGTRRIVRARNTAGETREYNVLRLKLVDGHAVVMERPRKLFFPSVARMTGGAVPAGKAYLVNEVAPVFSVTPEELMAANPGLERHVDYLPGYGPGAKAVA